jgi:CubicO group peptidase (beta-lactamase class C family)
MSETSEFVRSIVANGDCGAGAQLVVRRGGQTVMHESFGEARPALPMTESVIQGLFCLTKPVVACAVCAAADSAGISLDDDVRSVSPRLATLLGDHRVSLRDVLSHRAGLHPVSAAEAMFMPSDERHRASERATFADGWRIGVDRAYSDFQGWNVLRVWLEDMTGRSFSAALRHTMLAPLRLHDCYFGVTADQWHDVRNRLGVNYQFDNGVALPLLYGLLRKMLDDPLMQTVGGHGSASAIAQFYEATLDVMSGQTRAGLPATERLQEMVQPSGPRATDPLCSTPVAFGLGFMVDLQEAFGTAIGNRAYGHLGLMGNAFGFADPDLDLVAVFVSNAFLLAPQEQQGIGRMRRALVDVIYRDVAVTV